MAAYGFLRRSILRPNPSICISQPLLYRGFATKLFVKGVSFSTTEETLAEAFSQYGQVVEAKLIMDKARNRSKGFGYVTFVTEEEAQNALANMDGKPLHGRVIFVDKAWPTRRFNSAMPIARGPPEPTANS